MLLLFIIFILVMLAVMFIRFTDFWVGFFIQLGWVFGQVIWQLLCVPYIVFIATINFVYLWFHNPNRHKKH